MDNKIKILGLSASKQLTKSICQSLGIEPFPVTISHFADGEILVRPDATVRSGTITIVQSLRPPVNENVMELLIAIDALKRASAKEINVVMPYYAYARQDRKTLGREPITSKLLASLLEAAGATRVAIVDIHSEQIQGFFNIPMDTLKVVYILVNEALKKIDKNNLVIVSPDYGGVKRARTVAARLNVPLAILDKRRPIPNQAEITNILGDVQGKDCLITDDIVDTAGTIVAACKVLKDKGAKSINIVVTHAIFSGPAVERITKAVNEGIVSNVYISNTIENEKVKEIPNLHVIDLGKYLSDVIKVYYDDGSISKVYDKYAPSAPK